MKALLFAQLCCSESISYVRDLPSCDRLSYFLFISVLKSQNRSDKGFLGMIYQIRKSLDLESIVKSFLSLSFEERIIWLICKQWSMRLSRRSWLFCSADGLMKKPAIIISGARGGPKGPELRLETCEPL